MVKDLAKNIKNYIDEIKQFQEIREEKMIVSEIVSVLREDFANRI